MMEFQNAMKAAAAQVVSTIPVCRWGIVTSTRRTDTGYQVKVNIQPEDVGTGWLPVLSQAVGSGWGLVCPPEQGMQAFCIPDTGDGEHLVVAGLSFSLAAMPPVPPNTFEQPNGTPVESGEIALVSKTGAVIRLCADGSILIKGELRIDGNVTIHGNVSAHPGNGGLGNMAIDGSFNAAGNLSDGKGSVDRLRGNYDAHIHGNSGPTNLPD